MNYNKFLIYIMVVAMMSLSAIMAHAAPLTTLQFDIVGMKLEMEPATLTVPKNIATQVNTRLTLPAGAGPELQAAADTMARLGVVEAQLRGPELTPQTLRTRPGQPFVLPAFAIAGDYFLDQIRLLKDNQVVMDALPAVVPIKVINEVMVTSVSSRPLTAEEIQQKGIVIDQSNFQVSNFQLAFAIDNIPFNITMPVATLPTSTAADINLPVDVRLDMLADLNRRLQDYTSANLPPEFDRPGLNFSIAALPFVPVPDDASGDEWPPPFTVPPINGLLVIPGNIGYLNQFFSVMTMVTNVAPDGTALTLRDVTAEISLPTGLDQTAGSYDAPGDDPLRLARISGVGQVPKVSVVNPGPDGVLGTADDITIIYPQQTGKGEHLVEGLREGSSDLSITITANLYGLPSGPVKLKGKALGSVFVRNPTFSISISHPATVRSGESYDLYATITNTSLTTANLVSMSLDRRAVSGARLVSDETVRFDSIPAGQSVVARFSLVAETTGYVSASQFTRDPGLTGSFQLRTGVGERGVALAPNAIVLPKSANALPSGLVNAAVRLLGQAFSIATAPAGALPANVQYVKKQTVVDRGRALGFAGQMVQFGEPMSRVLAELMLDWLGGNAADDGFDQLLRTTEAGREFIALLTAELALAGNGAAALTLQQTFGRDTVTDQPHLSAAVSTSSGAPVELRLLGEGGAVASAGPVRTLPYADLLNFANGELMAVAARPGTSPYIIEVTGTGSGVFDLGIVVPTGVDALTRFVYKNVAIAAGQVGRVTVTPGSAGPYTLVLSGGVSVTATVDTVTAGLPGIIGVRQIDPSTISQGFVFNPGTYIAVLFDRQVTAESAEAAYKANPPTAGNYAVDDNLVGGASLQPGGRLVYLGLQKPVGTLVPRSLTVANVSDLRGHIVPTSTLPISTILSDGARVFGQVKEADGTPVPGAVVEGIVYVVSQFDGSVVPVTLTRFQADSSGSFSIDMLPRGAYGQALKAYHPVTGDTTEERLFITAAGQRILVNPTFFGRGTVRGRVLNADGTTPVAGAPVYLYPPDNGMRRGVNANGKGEFVFSNVPVGTFTLESFIGANRDSGRFGLSEGLVQSAGRETVTDIIIVNHDPAALGTVSGRVFLSDGRTPAVGFTVYLGTYARSTGSIQSVRQATTDGSGSFALGAVLPQNYDLVAVDISGKQFGSIKISVLPRTTTSAVIVMEALGSVSGVVYNAQHQPVPGAIIAGGVALGTADGNGQFRIDGVPAGTVTILAGDPVSKKRGSQQVTVLSGQTVAVAITLESRATIIGQVRDVGGVPVPNATVRIPLGGGFILIVANRSGVYKLPDLTLGDYLIEAEPYNEGLLCTLEAYGGIIADSFTMGDMPATICGVPRGTNAAPTQDAAQQLYQNATTTYSLGTPGLLNLPPPAGFGFNGVRLFQDGSVVTADIRFLASGTASGVTQDSAGLPTGAKVRILYTTLNPEKGDTRPTYLETRSDAATGAFSFSGIPLFDLTTFQAAGLRFGDFRLQAAAPFSPTIAEGGGSLNVNSPNLSGIILKFPSATETNGTVAGTVYMPDGVTPAPAGTQVKISFGTLTVTTDAAGRFVSSLPIPAGPYQLTAEEPLSGLSGSGSCTVTAGVQSETAIRLLGLGRVTVTVKRVDGSTVAGAQVVLRSPTNPAAVSGVSDAAGTVSFGNLREGEFSVEAMDPVTALSGRTGATLVRDQDLAITVSLSPAGSVNGIFLAADGRTPVAGASIALKSGSAALANGFATSDSAGRFSFSHVPVGPFSVDGRDKLTGMTVSGVAGRITFEGEVAVVTLIESPRGSVTGTVLNPDGSTPAPGVSICLTGGLTAPAADLPVTNASGPDCQKAEPPPSLAFSCSGLQATTRPDGSFTLDGVPAGYFSVVAMDLLLRTRGVGNGRLVSEGETVVRNVTLAGGDGTIRVTVRNADGSAADNAEVKLCGPLGFRIGAVDTLGVAIFDTLVLGNYSLAARSLAVIHDGGSAGVSLQQSAKPEEVAISLRGTGSVAVTVLSAAGLPVPSATVTLNAYGLFGGTFVAFSDASGQATFSGVPVEKFHVLAESAALAGVAPGEVVTPGQTVPLTVTLSPSGTVSGRVLLPDGTTPAADAVVTLGYRPQGTPQPGTVQVTTGLDGLFRFGGIPVGQVDLTLFELVSRGVARVSATLASDGQLLDLGDLVLDNVSPRVLLTDPADGAGSVAPDARIRVSFSEPIARTSVRVTNSPEGPANMTLRKGDVPLDITLDFTDGDRTVILIPAAALASNGHYTVGVLGGGDGPTDLAGLKTLDSYAGGFTVRDTIPPTVVSISPAANEQQVPPEAVVRVVFSESVAPGFTMSLATAAGQPVAGRVDLSLGRTTAVFTPAQLLQANGSYTITLSAVTDLAGNPMAGVITASFSTVTTRAPVITGLHIATGVSVAGSTIVIQPDAAIPGLAGIEYQVVGVGTRVVSAPPYALSLTLPTGVPSLSVIAVAVDLAGNRSAPVTLPVQIAANQPPVVSFAAPLPPQTARQGQVVAVEVAASDDVELATISLSGSGAASLSQQQTVPPGSATARGAFTFTVPADAPTGGLLTLYALATDSSGVRSNPATVQISIADGNPPVARISSPSDGTRVDPGGTVQVVISATDNTGVARLDLAASGAGSFADSRTIAPALPVIAGTIPYPVPADARAGARIVLSATATDAAGNVSPASQLNLLVNDLLKPVVIVTANNGLTEVQAGTSIPVTVSATDNVAVSLLSLESSGAVQATASQPVVPPQASASFDFTLAVPAGTPAGSTITLVGTARDEAGNSGLSSGLTLTVVNKPTPAIVAITPSSAAVGSVVDLAITGQNTHFAQGQTTLRGGAGISVNGGAENTDVPITVQSPTLATARLAISPLAVIGPRTLTVTTGTETVSSTGGFALLPANLGAPVIYGPLAAGSTTVSVGNLLPGAELTILAGATTLSTVVVASPDGIVDALVQPLAAGDRITAIQRLAGVDSAVSAPVTVTATPAAPRINLPLLQGGTVVTVSGVTGGATVSVTVDGLVIGTGVVAAGATSVDVVLSSPPAAGAYVAAVQTFNSVAGPGSAAVPVVSPVPPVVRGPLAVGVTAVTVDQTIPGALVQVLVDGVAAGEVVAAAGGSSSVVTVPALQLGGSVTARQTAGGVTTTATSSVTVSLIPPAPSLVEPLFAGGRMVLADGLTAAADVDLLVDGTKVATATATGTKVVFLISTPLSAGAVVSASQTLAGSSGPLSRQVVVQTPGVPLLSGPIAAGSRSVTASGVTPGATLEVQVNGQGAGALVVPAGVSRVDLPVLPLAVGDSITAHQRALDVSGGESAAVIVGQAPASPLVAGPLFTGGRLVHVTGVTAGADLQINLNGNPVVLAAVPDGATSVDVSLSSPLQQGGVVTAVQSLSGVTGASSPPVTVVTAQAPGLPLQVTTEQGEIIVGNVVTGATVTLYAGALPVASIVVSGNSGTVTLQLPRQAAGVSLTATQGAYGVSSPLSDAVVVTAPLNSLSFLPASVTIPFASTGSVRLLSSIQAPAGGISVALSAAQSGIVSLPATVIIPQGQTEVTVSLTALAAGTTQLQATAGGFNPATASCTVSPPLGTIAVSLTGGDTFTVGTSPSVTVTLPGPAPAGGVVVTLSSSNGSVVRVDTPTLTIAQGQTSTTASVTGLTAGAATLSAAAAGYVAATLPVTVIPAQSITLSAPVTLIGVGRTVSGTITLSQPAPAGGVTVTLTSGDPAVVTVTASVPIPAGSTGGTFLLTGVGAGTAAITGSAATYADGTLSVQVTANLVTLPASLNVTYGGSTGVPISISPAVAPAGGLAVSVFSSNAAVARVDTATVTIPAGQSTVNATLSGVGPGSAVLTASASGFAAGIADVTVTATLNIIQPSLTFISGLNTAKITIQLESPAATPAAAPAGGFPATLTATDPTCVAVPASATIAAGLVSTDVLLAYGGSATLPCTTTVTASGPAGVAGDTVSVTVQPAPQITVNSPGRVGSGLMYAGSINLGASNHGGVNLTLTSGNPLVLLLQPNETTAGTGSITIAVPNGTQGITYYVAGLEGQTGTVTITASAPGFVDGSTTATVVQPGVGFDPFYAPPATTTSLSANNRITARLCATDPAGTGCSSVQAVRAGSSGIGVSFASGNTAVGTIVTQSGSGSPQTVTVHAGEMGTLYGTAAASGGVEFDPVSAGSTTVSVSATGYVAMTSGSYLASTTVTVTAPQITVNSPGRVGAGLMTGASIDLGANNHGGVNLTLTSSNPSVMLLQPNDTTAGTGSITIAVPNGTQFVTYYVAGIEGQSGTVTITASATGFVDGSTTATVVQPGVGFDSFYSPPATTTSLSANSRITARLCATDLAGTGCSANQAVRAGSNGVTVSFASSNAAAGTLVNASGSGSPRTVTVAAGQYSTPYGVAASAGGMEFKPVGAGSTTLSVSVPGYVAMTSGGYLASAVVTVTAPQITVNGPGRIGTGLMTNASVDLGASNHGGVNLTLTSGNPAATVLQPDATTVGTGSITIAVPNGTQFVSYYAAGVEGQSGTVTITASAPGFVDGTTTVAVVSPGITLSHLPPTTTTTLSTNSIISAALCATNPAGTGCNSYQQVRAGSSGVTVSFTSSNTAVGTLVNASGTGSPRTLIIGAGQDSTPYYSPAASGGMEFKPVGAGSTTVSVSSPGFVPLTGGGFLASMTVTVSAPQITVNSPGRVGAGLMTGASIDLGASNHGGVNLTLTSSSPSVLVLQPDSSTAGTGSITIAVPNGTQFVTYYAAGVEGQSGTVTITASAPGFVDGSTTATVVSSGVGLLLPPPATTTILSANSLLTALVCATDAAGTGCSANQPVRAGAAGVMVSFTSSNTAVGTLVDASGTGSPRTVAIVAGQANTPYNTPAVSGGVEFQPHSAGSTTVSVSAPGFVALTTGSYVANTAVTVTP